jgi:hypothetical protein
MTIPTPSAT